MSLKHLFTLTVSVLMLSNTALASPKDVDPGQVQKPIAQSCASQIDEKKLQIAKDLTSWLQDTLQSKQALVAVVARKGGDDVKKHDKTGMAHSGLAVYDPRAQTWIIYNLLNENKQDVSEPVSSIWRTAPLDFFYGQTGYEKDALVLIPDKDTQQRIYEAILTGNYKKIHFTDKYNLLSIYDSNQSLNCNKWILMNITAARIDDNDIPNILKAIHDGFEPGFIHLNPIEKVVVRKKRNVRPDELPSKGSIQTVTIESFYRSSLFEDKIFYSGQTL